MSKLPQRKLVKFSECKVKFSRSSKACTESEPITRWNNT